MATAQAMGCPIVSMDARLIRRNQKSEGSMGNGHGDILGEMQRNIEKLKKEIGPIKKRAKFDSDLGKVRLNMIKKADQRANDLAMNVGKRLGEISKRLQEVEQRMIDTTHPTEIMSMDETDEIIATNHREPLPGGLGEIGYAEKEGNHETSDAGASVDCGVDNGVGVSIDDVMAQIAHLTWERDEHYRNACANSERAEKAEAERDAIGEKHHRANIKSGILLKKAEAERDAFWEQCRNHWAHCCKKTLICG
jgi:hypothetical protein